MAEKHTPGPWVWKPHSKYGDMPALYGADGSVVCNFGDSTQYYPTQGEDPSDTDARLIAAAPEMAAFLQTVANYSKAAWADNPDQQRSAFALAARELLARIDGTEGGPRDAE